MDKLKMRFPLEISFFVVFLTKIKLIINMIGTNPQQCTFLIDGNFFFSRMAFGCGRDFKVNLVQDSREFNKSLCQGFSKLINTYKGAINHVIMTKDGRSWRKDVDMQIPQSREHIPTELRQYKANRNKDDYAIDIKEAMKTFEPFVKMLDEDFNVPLLNSDGAEGDDFMYLVVREELKKGRRVLIYTADGDSHQLVDDNVFILKEMMVGRDNKIVMNDVSMKEFFPQKGDGVSEAAGMHLFGSTTPKKEDCLMKHFKMDDTMLATPAQFLILKSIAGDKKDNIHPTFSWKNGLDYNPTTMYIKKALLKMGVNFEDLTIDMLFDELFMRNFIVHLIKSCPLIEKIKDIKRAYKANLKAQFDLKGDFKTMLYSMSKDIYTNTDLDGIVYIPTKEVVDNVLLKMKQDGFEFVEEAKTVKNNKFINEFLDVMLDIHPLMRDKNRTYDMFVQNRTLLYLNEKSIPKKVMDGMQEVYDLKSNKRPNIELISNYQNILGQINTSENIFEGVDDEDVDEKEVAKISDTDVDDIINMAFM